ncbi:MAG: DegV family protein [Acidimicrobiales bacterium]|jgi:DegV family protein with EDD domain
MAGIQIVADSACDLSPEMVEERAVRIVPLSIRFGEEEFVDREELSSKEFWDRVITGPVIPETAAPAPGAFQRAFLDAADEGRSGVLCITLSSRLSATYQAAYTAAQSVADRIAVRVVDSLTVTVGEGLLVLSAADQADQGKSLDEIAASVEGLMARTRVYGVLENLDFVRRGGRIGGAAHLVGSLLSIKPVLEVREGVIEVETKQRTRQRSLKYLASKALEAGPLERLAVANGAANDIGDVLDMLRPANSAHEMVLTDLGPVIGTHAGPGSVGLSFQLAL